MKRKFTKLIAALALLLFVAPPIVGWGQQEVTLWSEDFSSYSENDVPTGGTYSYVCTNGTGSSAGTTKIYDENTGGGTAPELLVGKKGSGSGASGGTFTAVIPLDNIEGTLTLTYYQNKQKLSVSSPTPGVSGGQEIKPSEVGQQTTTFTGITTSMTSLTIVFQATTTNNVRLDNIVLKGTTAGGGSQLTPSDLALTNAPVELEFDLYDNTSAQTISYTTSSTGEVTVSESDYINATVNANKTITVTPVAVTNGPQTITVSQAADDTYNAGQVTFTVDVVDNTPFDGVIFDATVDKDVNNTSQGAGSITKDNVTFSCTNGILGNGTEYRMYKNSSTRINTTDGSLITKIEFTCTSGNPASGFGDQDGWTTSGNDGVWTGSAESVSFTASGAQVRATLIKVTVLPNTNPSINAEDVNITYNAEGGNIAYQIENSVEGASIQAVLADGATITNFVLGEPANGAVHFTCDANATNAIKTATVTLNYVSGDATLATKDVTVTQAGNPNVFDNISSITEVGTTYSVKGTVVATNARGFIIGDGTGYVYTYLNSAPSQAVGNKYTVSGTMGDHNHVLQFNYTATITAVESSSYDNTPEAEVITAVPNYSTGNHLSTYLQFEGELTKSGNNYFVALGSSSIQISYPTTDQGTALTALEGKTVLVKGYFAGYNTSNYFTVMLESIEEVISTDPIITIAQPTENVPATFAGESYSGTLDLTYANLEISGMEDFGVKFYDAEGQELQAAPEGFEVLVAEEDPSVGEGYVVSYTVQPNTQTQERVARFKVYVGEVFSNLITITQEKFVVDYATLPFSYDGNGAGTLPTGFTVGGLGTYSSSPKMQFNSTGDYAILKINERPGELGFDIKGNSFSGGTFTVQTSTDGVDYTDLATYTALESTTQHQTFNNLGADVRYIKWIYTEKVGGNVGLGKITLAKYTAPQSYNLTIATSNDVTIVATNENITGNITNGGTAPVYSGSLVTLDVRPAADYVLDEILVTDADNGTHSVVPLENGLWGFYMPSNAVTVSAVMVASHSPVTYTRATSVEPGRHYIIVGENSGVYYAMGAQKPNNRAAKQISIEGTTATVTRSDVYEFTIAEVSEGVYSIQDDSNEGYLAAGSSSSNNLVTIEELTTNGQWTIEIGATTGEATVVAQGGSNNYMQFNHTSTLFSCYGANNTQHSVYLYVKNDRFQLDINGYTGTNDNYYLIASPVTVDPSTIDMTTGDFDLYAFNQAEDKEWRNWKGDENLNYTGHFNLVPGQGYLYAKKATEETSTYSFTLTGDLYTGNGKFQLVDGWNLLGNPYAYATQLDVTDYAVMNDAHDAIIPADDEELENPYPAIQRLQGVFVWGEAGSIVTFSRAETNTGAKHAGIVLNLTKNRGSVADRAIVRFGEGQQMPKFQLNENTSKLYIPQGGNAFSVVRSGNENEMPVNFEAEANGTYTLNVEVNALEVNYLHLIDNMTGADIDLLATPSYTFSAKTTDYASRFRLVFNASGINEDGASTSSAAFAFYNGSSWTVSNLGEATLQVVDVMGRVLSSETISGNTEVSLNQPAGIYMLRLVNGTDVKVQKIVVR